MKKFLVLTLISLLLAGCGSSGDVTESDASSENPESVVDEQNEDSEQNTENETDSEAKTFTAEEVAANNTAEKCYSIVGGKVYDLTEFASKHPGGERNILKICGTDGTSAFEGKHGGQEKPEAELDNYYIGELSE